MNKSCSEVLSAKEASGVVQSDLPRGDNRNLALDELFEVVRRFDPVEGMVRRT